MAVSVAVVLRTHNDARKPKTLIFRRTNWWCFSVFTGWATVRGARSSALFCCLVYLLLQWQLKHFILLVRSVNKEGHILYLCIAPKRLISFLTCLIIASAFSNGTRNVSCSMFRVWGVTHIRLTIRHWDSGDYVVVDHYLLLLLSFQVNLSIKRVRVKFRI